VRPSSWASSRRIAIRAARRGAGSEYGDGVEAVVAALQLDEHEGK
jgi:hypothetical protein